MQPHPWSGPDNEEFTPTVQPADVKARWDVYLFSSSQHAGGGPGLHALAFSKDTFKDRLTPGADPIAASYRAVMLGVLLHMFEEGKKQTPPNAKVHEQAARFAKWSNNDKRFTVMASTPLRWLKDDQVGQFPFDVEEFLAEVERS